MPRRERYNWSATRAQPPQDAIDDRAVVAPLAALPPVTAGRQQRDEHPRRAPSSCSPHCYWFLWFGTRVTHFA